MIPVRTAWTAAVVAMALELLVTFGLPAVLAGHSLVHDYISEAGATDSPFPGTFAAIGILAAVIHLVFVTGIWMQGTGRLHHLASGLFAGFFVFLAIGLAFQCDPDCALETAEAKTHFAFGLTAFLGLGLAALATLWMAVQRRDPWLGVPAAVLAVVDLMLLASDITGIYRGLTQRLTIVAMMVWSMVWMVRVSAPDAPKTPSTRPS